MRRLLVRTGTFRGNGFFRPEVGSIAHLARGTRAGHPVMLVCICPLLSQDFCFVFFRVPRVCFSSMFSSCKFEKKTRCRHSLTGNKTGNLDDDVRKSLKTDLRKCVRGHSARQSSSQDRLQRDPPTGSLPILSPRRPGNMVVDTSESLTPVETNAQTHRNLELNRGRVKLHRACQVSISMSPHPVSSSSDSYPLPRTDDIRSRIRDRQRRSRESRNVSNSTNYNMVVWLI